MSEYQYYEFQTVDRPLTEKERAEIGSWSSRTYPTSTQAIFTYSYSDFPKSPRKVVEKYFDAMLYLSNWGTRQLMFRLPNAIVQYDLLAQYAVGDSVAISRTEDHVILDICPYNEDGGGDWVEGEGWLSSLILLRDDLLNGDYRMLYLAWLHAVFLDGGYEVEEDRFEPPLPDNLQNLSAPLQSFIDFLEIDHDLLAAASEASVSKKMSPQYNFEDVIKKLSEQERIDYLVKMARGESNVKLQLQKRLRELSPGESPVFSQTQRRPAGELLKSAEQIRKDRKEKARQEAKQAKIRKLEKLAEQETPLWEEVYALIANKQVKSYDEAVSILHDLRELAKYRGQYDQFQSKIIQIQEKYSRLSGLQTRLRSAGLLPKY